MINFPYFICDEKHKKIAVYTAMLDLFVVTWHKLNLPMDIPGILPLNYNIKYMVRECVGIGYRMKYSKT